MCMSVCVVCVCKIIIIDHKFGRERGSKELDRRKVSVEMMCNTHGWDSQKLEFKMHLML